MDRIELFRTALQAWDRYAATNPDFAPWVGSVIECLLAIEQQRRLTGSVTLNAYQQSRLAEVAVNKGHRGPLGGLAVYDVGISALGDLLCQVQREANKMALEAELEL